MRQKEEEKKLLILDCRTDLPAKLNFNEYVISAWGGGEQEKYHIYGYSFQDSGFYFSFIPIAAWKTSHRHTKANTL